MIDVNIIKVGQKTYSVKTSITAKNNDEINNPARIHKGLGEIVIEINHSNRHKGEAFANIIGIQSHNDGIKIFDWSI